jgi:hypothetical protein
MPLLSMSEDSGYATGLKASEDAYILIIGAYIPQQRKVREDDYALPRRSEDAYMGVGRSSKDMYSVLSAESASDL